MSLSIIFRLMLILPIFQTWTIWNEIPTSKILDDLLYFIFIFVFIFRLIKDKKNLKFNLEKIKNLDENLKKVIIFGSMFLLIGFTLSMLKLILGEVLSIKGICWEFYKLTRNLFILMYAYLYVDKDEFYKICKIYINICILMVIISLLEVIFGLRFYEFIKFTPTFESYPDFYNFYVPQKRTVGMFGHPNVLGEFLAFGFIVLYYFDVNNLILFKKNIEQKIYLIILFSGILISSSRMTFILTIVITIYMCFRYKLEDGKKLIIRGIIITIPFGLFAIQKLLYKLWEYYYYNIIQGSTEMRLQAWKQAIMMLFDYPLGTGYGTWGDASAAYSNFVYDKALDGVVRTLSDSYLSHLIVENGIWTILLFFAIYYMYKLFNSNVYNHNYKLYCLISIHTIIFIVLTSFKSMGMSLFEVSFFPYFILGFSIHKITSKNLL